MVEILLLILILIVAGGAPALRIDGDLVHFLLVLAVVVVLLRIITGRHRPLFVPLLAVGLGASASTASAQTFLAGSAVSRVNQAAVSIEHWRQFEAGQFSGDDALHLVSAIGVTHTGAVKLEVGIGWLNGPINFDVRGLLLVRQIRAVGFEAGIDIAMAPRQWIRVGAGFLADLNHQGPWPFSSGVTVGVSYRVGIR